MAKKKKHKTKVLTFHEQTTGEKFSALLLILYFSFTFLYSEILLRYFTIKGEFYPFILYAFLFSMIYGLVLFLITSLCKKRNYRIHLRRLFLLAIAVFFLVHYFIFYQFKIFYDLNTITAGAMGVITGFYRQIVRIVFTLPNFLRIILFFIPVILYTLFTKLSHFEITPTKKAITGVMVVLMLCVNLLYCFLQSNPKALTIYEDQYHYQNAISYFGLITGSRLDLRKKVIVEESTTFIQEENIQEETIQQETKEEPVVYQPNVLDIDFEALSNETTGTIHDLNTYVASLTPSYQNEYTGLFKDKNLIFITAEAFSAEAIREDLTPTLYRLANKGIQFLDYYQPSSSGTTGGEYQNIFGLLPTLGGASLKKTANYQNVYTMGYQLNELGYEGWAFHNNDYTFYDRHKTHNQLGYSHGFMGYGNGLEEYITKQWPQSDLEMIEATFPMYSDAEHFNVYYMTVSGHNGYRRYDSAMVVKHWDRVKDLPYSDEVKGYLASQLELEDALKRLVELLEEKDLINDTVIVIASDHFPYGLDEDGALGAMPYLSELYGDTVDSILERDHNRLILWCGSLETEEPIIIDTPTSSLDILPTLFNLYGISWDSRLLPGRDVFSNALPLMFDLNYNWKTDKGSYNAWTGLFTANEGVEVDDTYVERMKGIVRNKINYCKGVLQVDYFDYLFAKE